MELSEIEKDILEKASAPGGTNYRNHSWIAAAEFSEIAENLVEKKMLYKICLSQKKDCDINIVLQYKREKRK